jgi:SAM-dependent methyltransferase
VPEPGALPREWFDRVDASPDPVFYALPRLVNHIDDATIAALSDYYREVLPPGGAILDLMSSWVSHLPADVAFGRVAGLGMNRDELAANPRLTEFCVHDLNTHPALPYPAETFDAVLCAVSVQYLVRPVELFADVRRVLRRGGISIVAMSHRCFPTKAVRAFHVLPRDGRFELVATYHALAGGFDIPERLDRSPAGGADPLWIVTARRSG